MKKLAIRCGIGVAILAVALVAFFLVENYRGRSAWESYQKEAIARGEVLSVSPPPEIPDEENFAAIPFFQAFFGGKADAEAVFEGATWKKLVACGGLSLGRFDLGQPIDFEPWQKQLGSENLREVLSDLAPLIEEIRDAGRRPKTRFPLNYDDISVMGLEHITALVKLSSALSLNAKVSLAEGKSGQAVADLKLIFRLGDAAASFPLFMNLMIRDSINRNGINVIWEGLALRQWKKADLEQIKVSLEGVLSGPDVVKAAEVERGFVNQQWLKSLSSNEDENSSLPTKIGLMVGDGWLYQNQVAANRNFQRIIEGFSKRPIDQTSLEARPSSIKVYSALADASLRTLTTIIPRSVQAANLVQQAIVACALEEYRIDHGSFPEALKQLVPTYLAELPLDPLTAAPQNYRFTDHGSYLLYSVGWNLKDDGGTVVMKEKNRQDEKQGDWVWYGTPQK